MSEPDNFGCNISSAKTDGDGYAYEGKSRAHIVAFTKANGAVPAGMFIDHLCRRRNCRAVHHLELVTQSENEKRKVWAYRAARTHCPRGHELHGPTEHNAVTTPEGGIVCRQCNREAAGAEPKGASASFTNATLVAGPYRTPSVVSPPPPFVLEDVVLERVRRMPIVDGVRRAWCHPEDFFAAVHRLNAKVLEGTEEHIEIFTPLGVVRVFACPDLPRGWLSLRDVRRATDSTPVPDHGGSPRSTPG